MKILTLGHSSIASRRVFPALDRLPAFTAVDIASRRPLPDDASPQKLRAVYDDYAEALRASDAELVYVSLVNSAHREWAEAALDAGKHVVVDKPAVLDIADLRALTEIARRRNLCLAEATVFADHPQVDMARDFFTERGGARRVVAVFSIPPLPADNFRYDPALGGGALFDMGPYAAATGRLFFSGSPASTTCRVLGRESDNGVDTAFSVLAVYPGGGSLIGHFGFDTEYQNRIQAFGPGGAISIDRFFTTPPDLENTLEVAEGNRRFTLQAPAQDSFASFFQRLNTAIGDGDWATFTDAMNRDAEFIHDLRAEAELGKE